MADGLDRLGVHTRTTFVRSLAVKENAETTRIIDAIFPYFPARCQCIAGYLDEADQYWKVNYHWDHLVFMIDRFLAAPSHAERLLSGARAVKAALLSNPPDPRTGYRNDALVGATKDQSPRHVVIKRHATLKQSKRDFERILLAAGVIQSATRRNPPKSEKAWWLAVAPIAAPSISMHGTGYALDISGDNNETSRIARALGATCVFNESSHVHVEWKNGVCIPRSA